MNKNSLLLSPILAKIISKNSKTLDSLPSIFIYNILNAEYIQDLV